jgi:hypothetical protein
MTPDTLLIVFSSLGFASVFLALVIGLADRDPRAALAAVSGMTPAAKRQARYDRLVEMTQLADEAIEARAMGGDHPARRG